MRIIPSEKIAIFWDYENVPFEHKNLRPFVNAMNQFIKSNTILFGKCFYRDINLSKDTRENIRKIQHMKLKKVIGTQKNVVDNALIRSCKGLIRANSEIQHVVIISGDGDYLKLSYELKQKNIQVSVICPIARGNLHYLNKVHVFSYKTLIKNPDLWWQQPEKKPIKRKIPKKISIKRYSQELKAEKISLIDNEEYEVDDILEERNLYLYDEEDLDFLKYDEEELEKRGIYVYDDGDGEYQGYDHNEPAFSDDETDQDEMIYDTGEDNVYY